MAETIVNWVLGKLGDALVKEVLLLYSVDEKVETVNRELSRIQAFLKDADRKQIKDERQKHWVKEVRDVAHSIEDVIDTFLMEIPQNPQKPGKREAIKNMFRKTKKIPAVQNLIDEITQIQTKMKEIEDSRVRYGINNLGEGSGDIKLPVRPRILPDIDPNIVGFKADQNCIVKELLDENTQRRSVVSICGTGGLGKTTLAQKVYNCNDVKGQFGVRVWVAISETFEVIDVLRKIAQKLELKLTEQPNDTEVILTKIHTFLRGKKYLIVLDDVWTTDLWPQIGATFPDENNGSRVIVTTRFADVPKGMDPNNEPYMLKCLTKELSRELLIKTIFPNHDPNKISIDDLFDVLDQFVHMCGGLPLALVVLGGLLLKKPRSYVAWSSVFRTMSWHDVEGINLHKIIGTSYEHLSFAQKSCFMYFAAFSEDYTINAPTLLQMWIAEGFIPQEDKRTLEETAESFLEDLVQRSIVQVDSRSKLSGSIETLHIHDLLRDLAIRKAKEGNFLLVYSNPDDKMRLSKARRVAIHNPDCDQLIMSPNLHTLLCFHNGSMPNCSKQRLLKVVSSGEKWENIIELGMFEGLTQLRYLSIEGRISDNRDQEFLEKVIGRMKFLQTLHIPFLRQINGEYFEFPKNAWNIKTLRDMSSISLDDGIELPASTKLTNLQTIDACVGGTQSWEREVPHIPNLRSLQLDAESSPPKAVVTFLSTLEHLTNLDLMHDDSVLDILDMRGFPFYNHLQSLTLYYYRSTKLTHLLQEDMLPCHLIYLHITEYKFQQDIMPVLEKLRCLKYLKLQNAFENRKMTCSSGGFSQLDVLDLYTLPIEEWEIEEGAMPILKELQIYGCDELDVPQGLQYLTNLQDLMWDDVDDSKADLVRNLCQHVPSISLEPWIPHSA